LARRFVHGYDLPIHVGATVNGQLFRGALFVEFQGRFDDRNDRQYVLAIEYMNWSH
jgi:hypothetical protein